MPISSLVSIGFVYIYGGRRRGGRGGRGSEKGATRGDPTIVQTLPGCIHLGGGILLVDGLVVTEAAVELCDLIPNSLLGRGCAWVLERHSADEQERTLTVKGLGRQWAGDVVPGLENEKNQIHET